MARRSRRPHRAWRRVRRWTLGRGGGSGGVDVAVDVVAAGVVVVAVDVVANAVYTIRIVVVSGVVSVTGVDRSVAVSRPCLCQCDDGFDDGCDVHRCYFNPFLFQPFLDPEVAT